jgi:hypothetical protein
VRGGVLCGSMNITDFTLKLIFILIPGAMASLIFEKLTVHRPWNSFKFTAHSILFGLLAYLVTDWFIKSVNGIFSVRWKLLSILNTLSSNQIPFIEIGKATITGIVIGFVASAVDHHKWINRFARYLNLSRKFGDINLYSDFLESKEITFIQFRDSTTNLIFQGFVDSFLENDELKEIVLSNVTVFKSSSDDKLAALYKLKALYLSRRKDDVLIEIPLNQNNEKEENSGSVLSHGVADEGSDKTETEGTDSATSAAHAG